MHIYVCVIHTHIHTYIYIYIYTHIYIYIYIYIDIIWVKKIMFGPCKIQFNPLTLVLMPFPLGGTGSKGITVTTSNS